MTTPRIRFTVLLLCALMVTPLLGQEARRRWEMMIQIRRDKFDLVLPEVMRENGIDMWITMMREANYGPLWPDLGFGYIGSTGYYVFTDRGGDRIERAALGISGYMPERSGAYDYFGSADELAEFVRERDPKVIGLNISREIGGADGLSHSGYLEIVEILGEPWTSRIVSSERLVSDFRSRRVASEIAAFAEAGELSRQIAERALSNEVITPGVTTLEEVAWWIQDRLFERGLGLSFGMPSIYITGPDGIEANSNERIIQRGDLMMIDWGIGLMNFYTDMKRVAYVLEEGKTEPPAGIRHAFARALEARDVVRGAIKAGVTAKEAEQAVYAALEAAGFKGIDFNQPTDGPTTDVVIGCHSVGNSGHGIGPSIAFFNPKRITFDIKPSNLFSIELFAYTAAPEWGGKKVRIPLEDDAIVTQRGVEWLYPVNDRILLIK
jgi:Xaa-Pro aminopeptidase